MFLKVKHIHLVGIGGIGMSGIAEILLQSGYKVSGSDQQLTEITARLERLGATVYQGHSPQNPEGADVVVYSSAVKADNPELEFARERGIPLVSRAEMLAELMRTRLGVAVAGTHGKTTTTAMIGSVMSEGGYDPTIIVGGVVKKLGTNAILGRGDFLVTEADEFDRSFLKLTPVIGVITSLEAEHLDCYKDLEELKSAFVEFANKVPFYGWVILCWDEGSIRDIAPKIQKRIITYGLSPSADLQAQNINFYQNRSGFEVIFKGRKLGGLRLQLPGVHNVKNSLAAVALGMELDISFPKIKGALEGFEGVLRRFEIKADIDGIMVVDDYAHHPTEIEATLNGARKGWDRRIVAVFQPHLYTRTRDFHREFGRALLNTDALIVADVYPAREEPIPGVTGELIAQAARDLGHREVYYLPDKRKIAGFLLDLVKPGDMVITMGAGDIWQVGEEFIQRLKSHEAPVV